MNTVPVSIVLKWVFNFARIDGSVVAEYFAAREADVKHRRYSVLVWLTEAVESLIVFFQKLGEPPSICVETLAELYTTVYNWFQGNDHWVLTMSEVFGAQFLTLGKRTLIGRTGQRDYKVYFNEKANI